MSAELTALEILAADYTGGLYRLSPISLAVLFYATKYWKALNSWQSPEPLDTVSNSDWDTINAYVDGLLYEAKAPMLGCILPFATDDFPTGILPCDGSTFSRVDYPDLYAVLAAVFIVDADNFITPDLRGRTILGAGTGSGLSPRATGDTGGEETHQLDTGELAAHDHTIPATATTLAVEPGEVTVLTPVPFFTQNTGSTGGDNPHNNMQPFAVLFYGIVAQ
jgi:microcystin-dependent protein